jgi:hypothetical protein
MSSSEFTAGAKGVTTWKERVSLLDMSSNEADERVSQSVVGLCHEGDVEKRREVVLVCHEGLPDTDTHLSECH